MYAFLFLLAGFIGTELASWFIHKYLMHGPLWFIHKTHHQARKGFFEANDVFTFFFGSVAVCLIIVGISELSAAFWVGCGISAYGTLYFFLHDVLIHRRMNFLGRPKGRFLKGIYRAHAAHHKHETKEDAESFGLFIVPTRFFKK